jgi:hypothetical protein
MAIDYTSTSIARSQAGPQVPRRHFFCDEVGRREFVCGGGASVLSVILGSSSLARSRLERRPSLDQCLSSTAWQFG